MHFMLIFLSMHGIKQGVHPSNCLACQNELSFFSELHDAMPVSTLNIAAAVGVTSYPVTPFGPGQVSMPTIKSIVAGAGTGSKP
jgi:hypothetical protein